MDRTDLATRRRQPLRRQRRFRVRHTLASRAGGADHLRFGLRLWVAHGHAHQEPVHLGLGQRIGSVMFQRVLRRNHQERIGQLVVRPVQGDVVLFHRLQQRTLRARAWCD